MMNQTETSNHWLAVQLVGTASERNAIGAQVDVHLGVTGSSVIGLWVVMVISHAINLPSILVWGLTIKSARLVVTWPSGEKQT